MSRTHLWGASYCGACVEGVSPIDMKDDFMRVACGMLLIAMGCAAEAPAVDGEVLAQQEGASTELVPALVFEWSGATVLLDGGIAGTFPDRFRLTELPAPPTEVLAQMPAADPRWSAPAHAVAAVAAVARDRVPGPSRSRCLGHGGVATRANRAASARRACAVATSSIPRRWRFTATSSTRTAP